LDEGESSRLGLASVGCRVSSVECRACDNRGGEGRGGRADLDQGPADLGPATCTGQLSPLYLGMLKIRSYHLSCLSSHSTGSRYLVLRRCARLCLGKRRRRLSEAGSSRGGQWPWFSSCRRRPCGRTTCGNGPAPRFFYLRCAGPGASQGGGVQEREWQQRQQRRG
jgi:hypothetical protein